MAPAGDVEAGGSAAQLSPSSTTGGARPCSRGLASVDPPAEEQVARGPLDYGGDSDTIAMAMAKDIADLIAAMRANPADVHDGPI